MLIGESKTFQFRMYICDILVAHLNQRSGTAFLDHWVMYVFDFVFHLGTCCLYTGFGRVLNFCVMIRSLVIFLFLHLHQGTGDTRSVLLGSGELFFQLMQLQIGCHCARILHAFQLVSLVNHVLIMISQSGFALGFHQLSSLIATWL